MTLADLANAPTEITFKGKVYYLRQPDQLEEGMFQRWLENNVLDGIERSSMDEARKERQRQLHFQDVAAGVYEAGGMVYAKAAMTPGGIAKTFQIICRDQGVSDALAKEVIKNRLRECMATLISKVHTDPKDLAAVLDLLGLPSDFFSSSSPTRPEEAPKTSPSCSDSAPTSSSDGSISTDTPTVPPSS